MIKSVLSKTYLVGYYGMFNTGDDALMTAAAHGVRSMLNADELRISTPAGLRLYSGEVIEANLKHKQRFPGQNRLIHYRNAIETQRVIFGGGSVFHNARDIDLKRDMMTLSGGRNHLALGVGLGPFVNSKAERSCARFLEECSFTGVRDGLSYDIARSIAPNANVELTFDLAPQLLNIEGFSLQPVARKGIAVCLCPHERLKGDSETEALRLKKLASALDTIQYFSGEPIYFVDFNGHPELGDRQIHEELAALMPSNSEYHFVSYDANPMRVLQRMATFRMVLSMRLHASIFAFLAETPFVSLNYHPKCDEWCEQLGLHESQVFNVSNFDPQILVNSACLVLSGDFQVPQLSVRDALHRSMKNWRMSYEYAKETSVHSCYSAL